MLEKKRKDVDVLYIGVFGLGHWIEQHITLFFIKKMQEKHEPSMRI